MDLEKLIGEIVPTLQKSIIGEIKTTLMNGVKDELAELLCEKLLSDEKNSFKNKILKEVADRKKIDETIKDLEMQIAEKDKSIENKDNEIKSINNKKLIKKIIEELEIIPHNLDILEQMVNTNGDIKEEDIKKQINTLAENYPFMFQAPKPKIQGYGDISNIFGNNNNYTTTNNNQDLSSNNGINLANEIKNLYGGFEK